MRIPERDLRFGMNVRYRYSLPLHWEVKKNKHKPPQSNVRVQHPHQDIVRLPPKKTYSNPSGSLSMFFLLFAGCCHRNLEAESEDITPASAKVDRTAFGTRVVHFPAWIYIGPIYRRSFHRDFFQPLGLVDFHGKPAGVVAFFVLGGIHEWCAGG